MDKKYEFTGKTRCVDDKILKQIIAVRDIDTIYKLVIAGEIGGYIETEKNLSHEGNCWVFYDSYVYEWANVRQNAVIRGRSYVHDHAVVGGNVLVSGTSEINGYASIYDDCVITGDSVISDFSFLRKNARVTDAVCKGIVKLGENAAIVSTNDYITVGPIGSRRDYTTFYKTKDNGIWVCCGCFNGSIKNFELSVQQEHHDTIFKEEYYTAIKIAKIHILGGVQK